MAVDIFILCAQDDKDLDLRNQLDKHLSGLKNQQIIHVWFDDCIVPGTPKKEETLKHLAEAQIILLLISKDFMASEFCNSILMEEVIARHRTGRSRVVPILLSPVDVEGAPFADLTMLPNGGMSVTKWSDHDAAFLDIVQGIRKVIKALIPPPPIAYWRNQAPTL